MFEKSYLLSVGRNPRVTDIAIRFEQNFSNGIFELLRATRAAHDGKLLAVPADVRIPNVFQNFARGATTRRNARQRPRLHKTRFRASPYIR